MSKVIVIGAGVAGLSTGSFLQKKGIETQIFEAGKRAGGLMTYWKRENYTIETCIHWMIGSCKENGMYKLWEQVLDIKSVEFVYHEIYNTFQNKNGETIHFYTNCDRLQEELLLKAPEDKVEIIKFCNAIRTFTKFKMPLDFGDTKLSLKNSILFFFQNFSKLGEFKKWSHISEEEYSFKFKNPFLREVIKHLFMPEMAMIFILFSLAWMDKKEAGYPIGGSKTISQKMETRFLELGGKIDYKSTVKRILVEDNKAIGVELENGEKYYSDIVVSACDGMQTLKSFLQNNYTDTFFDNAFSTLKLFPSYLQVSLGVKKSFDELDHIYTLKLETPIVIDPKTMLDAIHYRIFNIDKTLSPAGSTLITVFLPTYNFDYWATLKIENLSEYTNEKNRILSECTQHLQKHLGKIDDLIDMKDVSTPSSVYRYTRNYKGSMEGWIMTKEVGFKTFPNKLKNLDNFFMVGQWVTPGGGLPAGLMGGFDVSKEIAQKLKSVSS